MKITEAMIRTLVKDDKWRTVHDLAVAMSQTDIIPSENALRAAKTRRPEDRLVDGYARLLEPALATMVAAGRAARREAGRLVTYQVIQPGKTQRVAGSNNGRPVRFATDDEMTRPDESLVTGLGQAVIYRLLRDRPGIAEEELLDAVEPCWKPIAVLLPVYLNRQKHKNNTIGTDPEKLTPAQVRHVKRQLLRENLRHTNGRIRVDTVTRLYLGDRLAAHTAQADPASRADPEPAGG